MRVKTTALSLQPCLVIALCLAAFVSTVAAQTPAKGPASVHFTATTENVSVPGESIKINLTGWSTDEQRDEFVAAWSLTPSATAAPAGGRGGRGGRGGGAAAGRGGRGGRGTAAAPTDVPADPDLVDPDNPAFRFGRGGARGGGNDSPPATPEAALAAAIKKAPTVGILWTSETVGYSIKYAYRIPQADGGERIVLATDRRVGAWNNRWKPVGSVPTPDYPFSIIELRVTAKGDGEGRGVVAGKVSVDDQAKTIALDSYGTMPVILKGVKRGN